MPPPWLRSRDRPSRWRADSGAGCRTSPWPCAGCESPRCAYPGALLHRGGSASWSGLAAWWRLVSETYGDRLLRCKGILRIRDTDEIVFVQGVQRIFHRPEKLTDWRMRTTDRAWSASRAMSTKRHCG
ncbi:MAG: GTP-binding protein [Pseudomonadota bacterium]